jgi:hypothetical protein
VHYLAFPLWSWGTRGRAVDFGSVANVVLRSRSAHTRLLMSNQATDATRAIGSAAGFLVRRGPRVAVVFERGRRGAAALRRAHELAQPGGEICVLTLAPQAEALRCCGGGGAGPYNCAVRDEAELELEQARGILESGSSRATFTVLLGRPHPPLAAWVAEHAIDVVVLPSRPFARGGSPWARPIRRATAAEVRVVK